MWKDKTAMQEKAYAILSTYICNFGQEAFYLWQIDAHFNDQWTPQMVK